MSRGRLGSAYRPDTTTAIRFARWRTLASRGVPVDDIAAALGISRATLDQMVCRARRRGHPDAILHPEARIAGSGTWQLTGRAKSHHRAQKPQRPNPGNGAA